MAGTPTGWVVLDDAGAPRPGLTSPTQAFILYEVGMVNNPVRPPIVDRGNGSYGFNPPSADVAGGLAWVVDNGVGSNPRYVAGSCYPAAAPVGIIFILDANGALWAGAAPTISSYLAADGTPLITPVLHAATTYLHTYYPTTNDVILGASALVVGPADSSVYYELQGPWDSGGGGSAPPVVSNVVPPAGTAINYLDTLGFDVTDDSGLFRRIIVHADFPALGIREVVHDGDSFGPAYSEAVNQRTVITNGFRYVLRRRGGWPASPSILPYAIDRTGEENA